MRERLIKAARNFKDTRAAYHEAEAGTQDFYHEIEAHATAEDALRRELASGLSHADLVFLTNLVLEHQERLAVDHPRADAQHPTMQLISRAANRRAD